MRSFEAVYGPKTDRWLVYTVGGLLATVGSAQRLAGWAWTSRRTGPGA